MIYYEKKGFQGLEALLAGTRFWTLSLSLSNSQSVNARACVRACLLACLLACVDGRVASMKITTEI